MGAICDMRLLVINPTSTATMTTKIGAAARAAAGAGTDILAINPKGTPVSIEGYYDEALSVPGMLEIIRTTSDFNAVIIACFDDTGLDAARSLTDRPVIGIGEAAYHFACMLANKFSVVTTLARSVPALEHNLHRYGMAARCARVRSSE
ncbi:MAG: aspartate/glutamate racemase family protein, partial [Paracoccaceae bacterium]